MKTMEKTFDFGKIDWYGRGRKVNAVTVDVELSDSGKGPEFSACACVWNARRTDIVAGGQCLDELGKFKYLGGNELFQKIRHLWRRHNLNGMCPGTPEQEAYLKEHRTWRNDYDKDCECLKKAGLYRVMVDGKPYEYGHAWLYRPIPADDLAEIEKLLA